MKSWFQDNVIEMYSVHNQEKSVFAETFIRTLENKIYKYMTSVSKNECTDNLADTVNEHNMGLNTIDLNKINFGNDNFDEDDSETIIHVRFMAWCDEYKQRKACKKEINKELVPVARHPRRWCSWCMSEDVKKRNRTIFD